MEKAVRALAAPVRIIERAEREDRLPPGSGLLLATGLSLVVYAALIAAIG